MRGTIYGAMRYLFEEKGEEDFSEVEDTVVNLILNGILKA